MRGAIEVAGSTSTLVSAFLSKASGSHAMRVRVGGCVLAAVGMVPCLWCKRKWALVDVGSDGTPPLLPSLPCRPQPSQWSAATPGAKASSTLHPLSRCGWGRERGAMPGWV